MLDASAGAWNRGDLDGFVSTYADDSATTFVSGGQVQRGFAWIRQNYAPRFAPGARRDSLRFERFVARPLGREFTMVTARYVLFRGDSVTSSGPFTLILRRQGTGWKIIHDHTSSDPRP
jgi:ketosteroid isomerase-like protein